MRAGWEYSIVDHCYNYNLGDQMGTISVREFREQYLDEITAFLHKRIRFPEHIRRVAITDYGDGWLHIRIRVLDASRQIFNEKTCMEITRHLRMVSGIMELVVYESNAPVAQVKAAMAGR